MVLTNAQRQTRYRQRLKARATGADVGQQAQAAVDEGFVAEAGDGFAGRPVEGHTVGGECLYLDGAREEEGEEEGGGRQFC